MELRVLRYFKTVVDEGSITDAARALHVTQPTLSRQLAQLEQEVGAQLFTRGRGGIELSDRGAVLNRYARDILVLVDKAEAEVSMPQNSVAGTVHIGAGETRAFSVLATACERVRARYPGVTFEVHDGTSADLKAHFARGFYDFLLDCGSGENAEFNQVTLPIYDIMGIVARRDDAIARLDAVTVEDLRCSKLIAPRQRFGGPLRDWAGGARAELEENVVSTFGLALNSKHLVSAGVGVMICYGGLVGEQHDPDDLCFRPLTPRVEAHHKVLWRKTMPAKPAQALIDELVPLCSDTPAQPGNRKGNA